MPATVQEEEVDGTLVDDAPDAPTQEPAQASTAVVRRERRSEVIRPLDADQLIESFAAYQELLPRLLDESDYQAAGKDKDGKPKKFVKKSGWRKIATAFDLDVVRVHDEIERDEHGQPVRAMAVYRAIAPSGRSMDGDGYCSVDEDRFERANSRKKLENDLRATATTRAKNRAISDLVGMGDVSAEEVGGGGETTALPWWAEPATDDRKRQALDATAQVFAGDRDRARQLLKTISDQLGLMPDLIPAFVQVLAASLGTAGTAPATEPPAADTQPEAERAPETEQQPPAAAAEELTGEPVIDTPRAIQLGEMVRERGLTVRQINGLLTMAGVETAVMTKPGVEKAILALTPAQANEVERQLKNVKPIESQAA